MKPSNMRHLFTSAALLLVVMLAFTSSETYYVQPTASAPCPEEGVPCLTLSQYARKPNSYFASNTTLILLPGNHSLDSEFGIRSITNFAIIRNTTTANFDSIVCSQSARLTLNDIGVVSIRGLVLIGCMNNNIISVEQFTLEDCSLQGQGRNGTGLEIFWVTTANIVKSSFNNNAVTGQHALGGAVFVDSSNITIYSTTFNNNTVTGQYARGGAVYADSSNITTHSTTFNNNNVTGQYAIGGAAFTNSSNVTIHCTTFNNNTVTGQYAIGGAVFVDSSITIRSTTFNKNIVTGQYATGGAVYVAYADSSNITIHSTTFNNNVAIGVNVGLRAMGGAVGVESSNIIVHSTTFNNNTVTGQYARGGAVYADSSNVTIHCTTFNNNTVTGHYATGGAVYAGFADSSNITICSTTFNNNTAIGVNVGSRAMGGAVRVESSNITICTTTFNNNTVTGDGASGGTVDAYSSIITILNTTTFNNSVSGVHGASGGAMYTNSSIITIHNTTFNNNTVSQAGGHGASGGAVHAYSSTVNVLTAAFSYNTVTGGHGVSGGAVYARSSNITINTIRFNDNTVNGLEALGGAVFAGSSNITIHNNMFNNNKVTGGNNWPAVAECTCVTVAFGGSVAAAFSIITIHTTTFNNNTVTGYNALGGAMYAWSSNTTISTTTVNNNAVTGSNKSEGGAVFADSSNITIHNTMFNNNKLIGISTSGGGAIYAGSSNTTIHNTTFNNNAITGGYASGGAVIVVSSNITLFTTIFNNNAVTAEYFATGGAMHAQGSNITILITTLNSNTVTGHNGQGGAIYLVLAFLNSAKLLTIKNNMADIGSALYVLQSTVYFSGYTTISNNYGSLYAYSSNVTFMGKTNIMKNSYSSNTSQEGGAITAIQSEIVFTGTVNLSYNIAVHGGGISATQSKLYVYGNSTIAYNTASFSGGGIYAYQSEFNLENRININNNSAVERGGGIHVISSIARMTDHSKTYFVGNHAERGGGACLETNSKFYIVKKEVELNYTQADQWIRLEFIENFAAYGGALYINDDTNSATCYSAPSRIKSTFSSECFMQEMTFTQTGNQFAFGDINTRNIHFTNNSASKVGDAIYGGLLDRCTVNPYAEIFLIVQNANIHIFTPGLLNAVSYIRYITNLYTHEYFTRKVISSDSVHVCFCRDNQPDCSYHHQPVSVKKGETFTVSLVAVDQVNNTKTNSTILSYLSAEAGLVEGQSIQTTDEGCTELHYTVTSPHTIEKLHLYANGSCKDIGISLQTVNITFTPCPIGFKDTGSICDCNPELTQYIFNCSIDDESVQRKDNVWIAFMNTSVNESAVVTYPNCPFDYCYLSMSTKQIRIKVNMADDADKQCAFNRSGKLCGSCKDGLSLSLGSSRCMPCSNNWLALLIVFAIAGVALVAVILICNLTVAAGTVNGLLFYANIVSSNKAIFFSSSTNRLFTIFIAWLNLDFGFETCFFNGLNGYWKTSLQLAFPAYVIFLVVLIIKACEYSFKFARFMRLVARNNPVATLDTLVLLSYTKFIRTIISACQFATLEYSDGMRETVWLVDGNVKYFDLKHIFLFVAALVIFVLALAYTLLMLLWQWLLLCPNRKPFVWIRNSKLHGIMDAYFIAFNKNHRYWTGLLLLVRVLLYLVSALNGVNTTDPGMILLTISCVVGSLIFWQGIITGRVYRKWLLNVLDTSFLFNLLILSIATVYMRDVGGNQAAVANTSVSITFITFLFIISYHVYTFVLQSQTEKIKTKLLKKLKGGTLRSRQIQNAEGSVEDYDNDGTVSESVVDVPLIPVDCEGNPILNGFNTDEEDNASCTTTDNNPPTIKGTVGENHSQIEMKDFVSDNTSGISTLSTAANLQVVEVKGEEISDASDYDELAPLLPVNSS